MLFFFMAEIIGDLYLSIYDSAMVLDIDFQMVHTHTHTHTRR